MTCFPFFFQNAVSQKKRKKFNWVFVPMQGTYFFSKFSKFIIGKSLSFLASSSLYERMENIWRQCQGMLSCHFHVGFSWCERVSACLFSPGKFPFQSQTLPGWHILRVSRRWGCSRRRVSPHQGHASQGWHCNTSGTPWVPEQAAVFPGHGLGGCTLRHSLNSVWWCSSHSSAKGLFIFKSPGGKQAGCWE